MLRGCGHGAHSDSREVADSLGQGGRRWIWWLVTAPLSPVSHGASLAVFKAQSKRRAWKLLAVGRPARRENTDRESDVAILRQLYHTELDDRGLRTQIPVEIVPPATNR